MEFKKFVIIGNSNTGKTCLFDKVAEDMGLNPVGFRMKALTIENEFRGYYIHSIVELEKFHNNVPIQTSLGKGHHRVQLKEVYDSFGVECLKGALEADREEYNCIVIDELGRGEDTSEAFAQAVYDVLDSDAVVFVLMKNVTNSVTSEIRKRRDVLVYDLDNMSQDEVLLNIEDKLKK